MTYAPAAQQDPARSDARLIAWSSVMAAFIALAFAGQYAVDAEDRPRNLVYTWEFTIFGVVEFSILVGIVLLIAIGAPKRDLLALRPPSSWGIAAGVAAAMLVALFIVAFALEPLLGAGEEQGLTPDGWNPDAAPQFLGALFVVGVCAPIAEELMFRGLGFSLFSRFGRWQAILATGAIFGLAHGLLRGFLPLTIFGIAVAYLRDRTGSVYPGMLVHASFNTIGMVLSVVAGEQSEDALRLLTMLA